MLDRLLTHLQSVAPHAVEIPILQPADIFLDAGGEDLRRRIFITQNRAGTDLCLRPEFTIPVCLHHIAKQNGPCRYAYGGTVFRQARSGMVEFEQVGIEDLGGEDTPDVDAACIRDMVSTLAVIGLKDVQLTLGDQQIFSALVKGIGLPVFLQNRLQRAFGDAKQLDAVIDHFVRPSEAIKNDDEATKLALAADLDGLVALVENKMANANLAPNSGRYPTHIASRMIEKTRETQFRLSKDQEQVLRAFLSIEVPLSEAGAALGLLAKQAGDEIQSAISRLEKLSNMLGDLDITYRASFGRKLEYYTGIVLDAHIEGHSQSIGGGGRYNNLTRILGENSGMPAVGFSISLDRVMEVL